MQSKLMESYQEESPMTYSSTNGDGNTGPQNPWAVDIKTDKFERDTYFINRKLLSLGNKYYIYDEQNSPLFFVDRPVLAMKAEFTVYEDDSKTRRVLTVDQESVWTMMNYTFIVGDANGNTLGYLRRQGWQSILRRTWHIEDAQRQQIALATEDSLPMAILRRVLGHHGLLSLLVRTNFIVVGDSARPLGEYNRRMTITDKHILDLSKDPDRTFDRRLALALAIVLDNTEQQQ